MPFETFFARKALNARIAKDMPKSVPIQANEANYLAGAELYKQHCAVCHGLPLTPKTAIAAGMFRRPPLCRSQPPPGPRARPLPRTPFPPAPKSGFCGGMSPPPAALPLAAPRDPAARPASPQPISFGRRADADIKPVTITPKSIRGYKLPADRKGFGRGR